ncbi:hypothetical protein JZ751_008866 [Albula glossodonta]|uniref:Uncharacterized protein n=1 Tax=Albula glossodonta TaxID=121402 RepID=A0A8T2P7X8_9TELE|nr:hypothetical protein JZ751_008866 [Albula glossodonta]
MVVSPKLLSDPLHVPQSDMLHCCMHPSQTPPCVVSKQIWQFAGFEPPLDLVTILRLEEEKAQVLAQAETRVQDEVGKILTLERAANQESIKEAVLKERMTVEEERLRAQLYEKLIIFVWLGDGETRSQRRKSSVLCHVEPWHLATGKWLPNETQEP